MDVGTSQEKPRNCWLYTFGETYSMAHKKCEHRHIVLYGKWKRNKIVIYYLHCLICLDFVFRFEHVFYLLLSRREELEAHLHDTAHIEFNIFVMEAFKTSSIR